jgi:hypothetical protein
VLFWSHESPEDSEDSDDEQEDAAADPLWTRDGDTFADFMQRHDHNID